MGGRNTWQDFYSLATSGCARCSDRAVYYHRNSQVIYDV
uniref:Uncharacterized protein n=1 Tax=Anguilla anguilla TaxID=7936 RepID=A0A0E9XFC5_ANGAN